MSVNLRFFIPVALISLLSSAPVFAHFTSQSADRLQLAVGETQTITLTENPSTGYRWKVSPDESSNLDAIRVDDLGYAEAEAHLLGAPGKHSWRIAGVTPGKARLVLDYSRSWEHVPPAQRHIVDIEVTGGR